LDINDIILGCLKKDVIAEKQLHTRYKNKVYGICRMYIKDREQIKDCAQESFIKIYANLHKYDLSKGTFNTWIAAITRNTTISILKKKGLKITDVDPYLEVIADSSAEQAYEHDNKGITYEQQITYRDILAAIGQLPSGYFEVANLALIEQRKHKEIAESLDIAESSSRSKLTRAKKMLRSILKKPFM